MFTSSSPKPKQPEQSLRKDLKSSYSLVSHSHSYADFVPGCFASAARAPSLSARVLELPLVN